MAHESDFGTPANGEPTLVAPRFDESEARTANPVVPLSEVREPRFAAARAALRNWRGPAFNRSWPLVLLLFGVLAAGAVGAAVYRQQRDARLASEPQPAPEEATDARAADSNARSTPAQPVANGATRERRGARRAETQRPAREDASGGGGDEAALAGMALADFVGGAGDEEKGDGKERKRKRRGGKRGGDDGDDDGREGRASGRGKFSRGGAKLIDVIRHD